jgi:hypothetical protein
VELWVRIPLDQLFPEVSSLALAVKRETEAEIPGKMSALPKLPGEERRLQ